MGTYPLVPAELISRQTATVSHFSYDSWKLSERLEELDIATDTAVTQIMELAYRN